MSFFAVSGFRALELSDELQESCLGCLLTDTSFLDWETLKVQDFEGPSAGSMQCMFLVIHMAN